MKLKIGSFILLTLLFFACGEPLSSVIISYSLKYADYSTGNFYPLAISTREDYLHFERGKLIVDGAEYREISFSGGIEELKVSDLPEGTYDFYMTFFRGGKAVAWGIVKNVELKGGVKKHLRIVLNYQEDWE